MAVDFREVEIRFDPTKGQAQHEHQLVPFGRPVRRASAAFRAIDVGFTEYDDHPVWKLKVDIDRLDLLGDNVDVWVTYLLRDASGDIDDIYDGRVVVMVVAEVAN
ncbi:MAG TPA: hypothetical protein VF486_08605 [Actinomycetes bacterium]